MINPEEKYSKAKMASLLITDFTKILEDNGDLKDFKTDCIKVSNQFPNENICETLAFMLKTNNVLIKVFNKDKEKLKKVVDYFFNPNNDMLDFSEKIESFYEFAKDPEQDLINFSRNKITSAIAEKTKIAELYKSGILNWKFVRTQFPNNIEPWKVKEATAWLVAYVENVDFNLNEILVKNEKGFANKEKTFENLISKINKASLTSQPPFNKGKKYYFLNEAKSGEIDVIFWNEKTQKVIAACATRDRGFKIEGNQFFRHYLRAIKINDKIHHIGSQLKANSTNKNITLFEARQIVSHPDFSDYEIYPTTTPLELPDFMGKEIAIGNEFAKDLFYTRNILFNNFDIDFNKTKKNISEEEMVSICHHYKDSVNFMFYGEVLSDKYDPRIQAGLNCLSYRDNFNRIGNFSINNKAASVLMKSLDKRFNDVSIFDENPEERAHEYIISLLRNYDDMEDIMSFTQYYSKNNTFNEERTCFFKAFSVMFNSINEELSLLNKKIETGDKLPNRKTFDKALEKGIKTFFNHDLNKLDLKFLKTFMQDREKIKAFVDNFDLIQTLNSEVPFELNEVKMSSNELSLLIRHFNLEEKNYKNEQKIEELQDLLSTPKKMEVSIKSEEQQAPKKKRNFYRNKK